MKRVAPNNRAVGQTGPSTSNPSRLINQPLRTLTSPTPTLPSNVKKRKVDAERATDTALCKIVIDNGTGHLLTNDPPTIAPSTSVALDNMPTVSEQRHEPERSEQTANANDDDNSFNNEVPLEIAMEKSTRHMYQVGKRSRERAIKNIMITFKCSEENQQSRPGNTNFESFTTLEDIMALLDFLEQTASTPFLFSNLKENAYINKTQDIHEFTDMIYQALGSLLLIEEVSSLHARIISITKRLLGLLERHDPQILERAISKLLEMMEGWHGSKEKPSTLTIRSPAPSVGPSSNLIIKIPVVLELGFANILKVLYPFWGLNKNVLAYSSKFLKCIIETWHSLDELTRCKLLEGFPTRILLRVSQCQFWFCELVEEVSKHILQYGVDLAALDFLNQVWMNQLVGDTVESTTYLHFRIAGILVDIIFGNLFEFTTQCHAKKYLVELLERLKKSHKSIDHIINERFDEITILDSFRNNPLVLNLLDDVIYQECLTYSFELLDEKEKMKAERLAETTSEDLFEVEDYGDEYTLIDLCAASNMWKTLYETLMTSLANVYSSVLPKDQDEINDFYTTLMTQTFVLAKLGYGTRTQLQTKGSTSSCVETKVSKAIKEGKVNYLGFHQDFMEHWKNIFGLALQRTSRSSMNEIMRIGIETLNLISASNYPNMQSTGFNDIKHTLIFYFSACCWNPDDLEEILKTISQNWLCRSWRSIDFSESHLLSSCISVLSAQIFDNCSAFINKVLLHAMKRYTSCTGIAKGILGIIGDFVDISKSIDLNVIMPFLVTCAQNFGNVWNEDEEFELLLTKAFTRLVCFIFRDKDNGEGIVRFPGCEICTCVGTKLASADFVLDDSDSDLELLQFAQPLFMTKSEKVKLELLQFLIRFKNHARTPKMSILKYFLLLIPNSSHVLRVELFVALRTYLESDGLLNPRNHDALIDCVFIKLRSHSKRLRGKNFSKEIVSIVAGLHEMSQTQDLHIHKQIIKYLVGLSISSRSHKLHCTLYKRVIESIAKQKLLAPWQLMGEFRNFFSEEFVKQIFKVFFRGDWTSRPASLVISCAASASSDIRVKSCCGSFNRLMFVGSYNAKSTFMEHYASIMISKLLPDMKQTRKSYLFLLGLAQFGNITITKLLTENFPKVYPSIALCDNSIVTEDIMSFFKYFKLEPDFLFKCASQALFNELVSHLYQNGNGVMRGFQSVLRWQKGVKMVNDKEELYTSADIVEYMSDHLLGFYLYMQNKLSDKSTCLDAKKSVLRSFNQVISRLSKRQLSPTKYKLCIVLSSFSHTVPELHDLVFEIWREFAMHLSDDDLPDLLVQVLAAIKKLNPTRKEDAYKKLFKSLKYDELALKRTIPELYFVQDYVDKFIKSENIATEQTIKGLFEVLVQQTGHSNSLVRYQAVTKLRDLLDKSGGFDYQGLISNRAELHSDVWTLLLNLMRHSCGKPDRVKELATECIGLIGAVDPYRITGDKTFGTDIRPDTARFEICHALFLSTFLDKLSHSLQNSVEGSDFDIYAFVIQEVLRMAEISTDTNNPTWEMLSPMTRNLVDPMFRSKYNLKREIEPPCSYPIFGSKKGISFHDWAYNFIYKMVSCMEEPTNYTPLFSTKALFNLSNLIVSRNPDFASFLLPHAVLQTVLFCSEENVDAIIKELNLVTAKWNPTTSQNECADAGMTHFYQKRDASMSKNQQKNPAIIENVRCTNAIFSVIDYISTAAYMATHTKVGEDRPKIILHCIAHADRLKRVSIPQIVLSRAAFAIDSYHRALKYCEEAIAEDSQILQSTLSYLQRICVALDDLDYISGIAAINKNPSNTSEYDDVIASLAQGKREEAAVELQRFVQEKPNNLIRKQALVQAYLALDQPHLAYDLLGSYLSSSSSNLASYSNDVGRSLKSAHNSEIILHQCQLEACWRLEKWNELDVILKTVPPIMSKSWEYNLALALQTLKQNEHDGVLNVVKNTRQLITVPLITNENDWDSYVGRYDDVLRFHILSEIQQFVHFLKTNQNSEEVEAVAALNSGFDSLLADWRRRLDVVQNKISALDPILNVRKVLLTIAKEKFTTNKYIAKLIDHEITSYLLKIAKVECRETNYRRAQNYITQASQNSKYLPMVFIQEAKFLIKKGDQEQALMRLTRSLKNNPLASTTGINCNEDPLGAGNNPAYAKAFLIFAQLNDKLCNTDLKDNIANYTKACEIYPTEKNLFLLATYFDRILEDFQDQVQKPMDTQKSIVRFFCNSLMHGCKHAYQSLPRLLSIWFDHAASVPPQKISTPAPLPPPTNKKPTRGRKSSEPTAAVPPVVEQDNPLYVEHMEALKLMNNYIRELAKKVPTYVLLTVFSQLVSRICHNELVWAILRDILVDILIKFPKQTLWMLTSVRKSSFPKRNKKCMEIIRAANQLKPELGSLITDYASLAEELIALSNNSRPNALKKTLVREVAPKLLTMFRGARNDILIPHEQFLSVKMPRDNNNFLKHIPFPESEVCIGHVGDELEVMHSLQKPKKIKLRGTNGKWYGILCKPKDDLRKDSKVMEFNGIVNHYLSRSEESSQRNLRIRTYAVTPLNEQCGLVEWIDDLNGYRPLIFSHYKHNCYKIDHTHVKTLRTSIEVESSFEAKQKVFNELVKLHPEVLAEWFKTKFRNPQRWYKARQNYTRTAAVMSVIGYIIGLGDRHGENILFDTISGDLVHVDFNCLFNKGESLGWAERVPFRLTRNMINGFGPLGYEGVFRKSCEITLKILRDNMEVFLSTMQPFVFDPLVEWSPTARFSTTDGPINNEEARKYLNDIRLRLLGEKRNLTKTLNVRLSIEAQVNYLIHEATDTNHLCQMYPGWCPYL